METFNIGPFKAIKVVNVSESPHTGRGIIQFNEVWAVENEVLQDYNSNYHDIELEEVYKGKGVLTSDPELTFYYKGTAKVGETYYVKSHKGSLSKI